MKIENQMYQFTLSESLKDNFDNAKPWIAKGAVDWMDEHLTEKHIGLEFGTGRSTPWLCSRMEWLHSVETDPQWAVVVMAYMQTRSELMKKWSFSFVNADWFIKEQGQRRLKKSWQGKANLLKEKDFESLERKYLEVNWDEASFALVDGCIRVKTAERAFYEFKKKRGSIVVVDNVENPLTQDFLKSSVPDKFARIDFVQKGKQNDLITAVFVRK